MTEETNNDKKLSRQTEWFVLGAFATVALSAVTSSTLLEDKLPDVDKEVKWVTIVLAVTVGFSGLAFFAHLIKRDRFVGTPIEGGLVSWDCFLVWNGSGMGKMVVFQSWKYGVCECEPFSQPLFTLNRRSLPSVCWPLLCTP